MRFLFISFSMILSACILASCSKDRVVRCDSNITKSELLNIVNLRPAPGYLDPENIQRVMRECPYDKVLSMMLFAVDIQATKCQKSADLLSKWEDREDNIFGRQEKSSVAFCFSYKGNVTKATEYYSQLYNTYPNKRNPYWSYLYAKDLIKVGDVDKAYNIATKLVEKNRGKQLNSNTSLGVFMSYQLLAGIDASKHNYKKAFIDYKNKFQMSNDDIEALENMIIFAGKSNSLPKDELIFTYCAARRLNYRIALDHYAISKEDIRMIRDEIPGDSDENICRNQETSQ